jgi:hypothetical protein
MIDPMVIANVASNGPRHVNTPMRRIRSPCCARAASGQAVAAPPTSVMNSRRFMSNMGLPAPWVTTSVE